jgi:hypothetical protein
VQWAAFGIGFAGLLVAALGLLFNYLERSAGLRGALYTKQVEVYGLLLRALAEQHGAVIAFTTEKGFRLGDQDRRELRRATSDQVARIAQTFTENVVFLPKAVADAVVEYRKTFNAISAPPEVESQYPHELVHADDPQVILTNAFAEVWDAMRRQLGTDRLSEQTLRLVRTPAESD